MIIYSWIKKNLHLLYLFYAVPLFYLVIVITPPFQNPDEPNHFSRAEQISRGEFISKFIPAKNNLKPKGLFDPHQGGFSVDRGIGQANRLFSNLQFQPGAKVHANAVDSAKLTLWNKGIEYRNFGNTAIYPPFVYLMPTISIMLGKWMSWPVIKTLYLSRFLNAALVLVLGVIALKLARSAKLLLFTLLLLPMHIATFCAVTQDSILIVCSFLLVAFVDYGETERIVYQWKHIAAMIVLAAVIGICKPPYILFSFIILFITAPFSRRLMGTAIPFALLAIWLIINSSNFKIQFAPAEMHVNSRMQIAYVLHHPFKFMGLFFKWDYKGIAYFFRMCVGVLGWVDTQFSKVYYIITYTTLIFMLAVFYNKSAKVKVNLRAAALSIFIITSIAILAAQYATWVPYQSETFGGLQGRYFLPVFPFLMLAVAFSKNGIEKNSSQKKHFFVLLLTIYPMYTLINIVDTLFHRYYIG
jgi:uncharacterized membrane protein